MSTSDGRCRSDAMIPGSLRRCCFRPPQAASERSARGDDHGGRVQETRAGWTRKRRRLTRLPTSSPFRLAAPTSHRSEKGYRMKSPSIHLKRRLATLAGIAALLVLTPAAGASAASTSRQVQALDDCDAATFNAVLGLTPVPECAGFPGGAFAATTVSPGDTVTTSPLSPGIHRFECLIHPWMQTTVTVG